MLNVGKISVKALTSAGKAVYSTARRAETYIFGHTPTTQTEKFFAGLQNNVSRNGKVGRLVTLPDGTKIIDESARSFNPIHSEPNIFKRFLYKMMCHIDSSGAKAFERKQKNILPIQFKKTKSISELKKFAKENLGIKICCSKKCSKEELRIYNKIVKILTDIQNNSQGEIRLPKYISINQKFLKKCGMDAATVFNAIIFGKSFAYLKHIIYHELGHLNHAVKANYRIMTMPKQLLMAGVNPEISNEFVNNRTLQNEVYKHLGWYAGTSPAEFVAETFAGLMKGKTYPKEIMDRYAMYLGPTNYKTFIKNKGILTQSSKFESIV